MKIQEIESMPHLYLDMDGVQADFFGRWAQIEKVQHYKHITNPEEAILRLAKSGPENVYHFFRDLDPLPGGQVIIRWLHQNKIPFTVLSAPLRMEGQASIKGKREWLDNYNPGTSGNAIFTSAKYKYATSNGKPNVLVDDFGKYLNSWNDAGGIAVKHSDDSTNHTIQQLEKIYHKYLGKKDLTI
jgi:5'(3')-deoxyribonucleotidase